MNGVVIPVKEEKDIITGTIAGNGSATISNLPTSYTLTIHGGGTYMEFVYIGVGYGAQNVRHMINRVCAYDLNNDGGISVTPNSTSYALDIANGQSSAITYVIKPLSR